MLNLKNALQISLFIFVWLVICSSSNRTLPIILGWNEFFQSGNLIGTIAPKEQTDKCPRKCFYSANKKDSKHAAVIVFHGNSQKMPMPKRRHAQQLYVFFSMESPYSSYGKRIWPSVDFFNLTMTYRAEHGHNLHAPYGSLKRVNFTKTEDLEDMWSEEEILSRIRHKKKSLLQIVSNCLTPSWRHFYANQLGDHINISSFGKCYGQKMDKNLFDEEIEKHFFYLAFENSVCAEYVTEKFWNPLRHLTVPIVLKRDVFDGLDVPEDSFIAADDFDSPKELAEYLKELQGDEKKYLRYFNWTRFYRKSIGIEPANPAICRLCDLAHQKLAAGIKIVPNIYKYWAKERHECVDQFGGLLIRASQINIKNETEESAEIIGKKLHFDMLQKANFSCKTILYYNILFVLILLILFYRMVRKIRWKYIINHLKIRDK